MALMLVEIDVPDYDNWRSGFDQQSNARQSRGLNNGRVYRSADDSDVVLLIFDVDNTDTANQFASSSDGQNALQTSGAQGSPRISFADTGRSGSAQQQRTVSPQQR